jgi:hypothetical protein
MRSPLLFACTLLLIFGTVVRVAPTRTEDKQAALRSEARSSTRQAVHSALAKEQESAPVRSATVRMEIHDNRVFVSLRVVSSLGKSVIARFWVDSGGDIVILSGRLAHELGLQPTGTMSVGMGETPLHPVTKPQISIAGMGIDLTDNEQPEITGVEAGDTLLRVGRHKVTGASLAAILKYLSGNIGDRKRLTVRRGKQIISIRAVVSRHP